jgi:hypothetical protein
MVSISDMLTSRLSRGRLLSSFNDWRMHRLSLHLYQIAAGCVMIDGLILILSLGSLAFERDVLPTMVALATIVLGVLGLFSTTALGTFVKSSNKRPT